MANDVSALLTTWLAGAFMANRVRRNTFNLLKACGRQFDRQPGKKGSTIKVPVPVTRTAQSVTASMTPPTPTDSTPTTIEIALDQHKYTDFALTDKQVTQIEAGEFYAPSQVESCIVGLLQGMNTFLHTKTHDAGGFYAYVGTAGTNPFNTNSDILADGTEQFRINKASAMAKPLILSTAAEKAAKKLAEFRDVSQAGTDAVRKYGMLPPVGGYEPYVDQDVPTHTTGAAGTILVDDAAVVVGESTVHFDGVTTLPNVGDIFIVAGDTQTYRITSTSVLTVNDADFTFYPPAKVAWADNASVTFKASHAVNVAFEQDAIQFVSRPLIASVQALVGFAGNLIGQADMQDPDTGVIVRASAFRGFNMGAVYFDALYGGGVVAPDLGVRFAG
jgi:P22 coat protein - gene protein 5